MSQSNAVLEVSRLFDLGTRKKVEEAIASLENTNGNRYAWLLGGPDAHKHLAKEVLYLSLATKYLREEPTSEAEVQTMLADTFGQTASWLAGISTTSDVATASFLAELRKHAEIWAYDPSRPDKFADYISSYLHPSQYEKYGEFIAGELLYLLREHTDVTLGELLYSEDGSRTSWSKFRSLVDAARKLAKTPEGLDPAHFRRMVAEVIDVSVSPEQFDSLRREEGAKDRRIPRGEMLISEEPDGTIIFLIRAQNRVQGELIKRALDVHVTSKLVTTLNDILGFLGLH